VSWCVLGCHLFNFSSRKGKKEVDSSITRRQNKRREVGPVFEKTRVAGHHTTRRLMRIGPHDSVPGAVANTAPRAPFHLKKEKKGVFVTCTRVRTWVRFRCLERHSMTISHSHNSDLRSTLFWAEPAQFWPLSYADLLPLPLHPHTHEQMHALCSRHCDNKTLQVQLILA
jgi:hypothetical protein